MAAKDVSRGLRKVPLVLVGGFGASVASMSLLGKLVEGVLQAPIKDFDEDIVDAMRRTDIPGTTPAMKVISSLGEPWALYPAAGLVSAKWLVQGRPRDAATLGIAIGGSALMNKLLKVTVQRKRPLIRIPWRKSAGSSFPSNHITMSMATYGTMALLVIHSGKRDKDDKEKAEKRRAAMRMMALALALSGLIGYSRIYLGVHHPSDVVAGWAAGTAWLVTCGIAANAVRA